MRKTFELRPEGRHPDRVLDAIKHELRRYMKRERRRALPEGADFWDFDCRLGADQGAAETVHPKVLTQSLDAVAATGCPQVYVELLAKPVTRKRWADGDSMARVGADRDDVEVGD
ncbi:MAG: DUF6172 family protein [Burkholderiaceae bacterium]